VPRRSAFKRRVLTKKYINLEGLPDLFDKLNNVALMVDGNEVYQDVLLPAAYIGRDMIKQEAPFNARRKKGVHLRDAVFAAIGDPSRDPRGPTVLIGVNRRKAPHAHLLEKGTKERITKRGRKTGSVKARRFFQRGLTRARPWMARRIAAGVKLLIANAVTKGKASGATIGAGIDIDQF
jgi:hypothetical protein